MIIKQKAFSLIEMLIVFTIISILAVISLFSYTAHQRKAHRIDAVQTLYAISLAEERYRTNNTTYGTLAQVWTGSATTGNYYSLAITNPSATGYTVTATAVGDQVNDAVGSQSCKVLTVIVNNGTITHTPANCWPQ